MKEAAILSSYDKKHLVKNPYPMISLIINMFSFMKLGYNHYLTSHVGFFTFVDENMKCRKLQVWYLSGSFYL